MSCANLSVMTANLPVVPSRESLHAGNGNAGTPAGIQTRNSDRFFTKHAPPASGQESFHDRMQRVQRVVGPEAAGASAHGNSGGGVNVRTGNTEVPKTGGATNAGTNGAPNTGAGQHSLNEGGRRIESGRNEGGVQNNTHSPNSGSTAGSNAAQDHSRGDRGGWSKFGPPTSRSGGDVGNGHSESSQPNTRNSSGGGSPINDHQINDRQTNGHQMNDHQVNDRPSISGGPQSSDRNSGQSSHTPESGGGWQKFPSNADHSSSAGNPSANRNDHAGQSGSGGNSKPPLELHRPIVTPRETPASEPRNSSPAQRSEPRYNPPAPRNEPRGSSSGSRSDSHQSRSSGGGSGSSSRGSGGGSSSHGGGGGHSDSKSSSGPHR